MVDESNPVISRFINRIKGLINDKADKTNATQSYPGLMSAEDKIKLDAIDTQYSINVEKQSTADTGFFSTYIIKQNNTQKGVKINIPKDFLVKSATVKTCNTANSPVSGYEVGDKYIDFVINSKDSTDTDEHLYLATKEIGAYPVDEVTLTVDNGKLAIKDSGIAWGKLATVVQDIINGKSPNNHNHDTTYIKKIGGVSQYSNGNILIPSDADSSNYDATGYIPFAHTIQDTTKTLREILPTKKSFIGAVIGKKSDGSSGNQYDYVISARHRNGGGDGYKYGMYIRAPWTTNGNLSWAESNSGDYEIEKIILDSNNYSTYVSPKNHTHKDEDILYNSSTQDKLTPLDMAFISNANRLAYLPANRIQIWTTTDGGSTWNKNVGTNAQKINLVTTENVFTAGNGSTTNYGQNQIRISLTFGDTNQNSDLYATVSKLLLRIGTHGASGTSVTVYTRKYGATNNYTQRGIYYLGGWTGWNAIPLEGTVGGYAGQTDGSTDYIQEIVLYFKQNSNSTGNLKVYEIKMIGEKIHTFPSQLSKSGHLYGMNENQDVIFPAKIIKNGGKSSEFLKANGDVEILNTTPFTVTYTNGTTSTINFVTR